MGSVIYSGGALADGRSGQLRLDVSILVEDGKISWIRPAGDEGDRPADCEYVDAGGTTIVPGLVDGHSHVSMPGGSHWIDRGSDPTEVLLAVAEANGDILHRSGVRWVRDVGSPRRMDEGRERALGISIRDRWRGRRDRPYVRAAGTWIAAGLLPDLAVQVSDGDALLAAALGQLDDGADLVKLYLDGPDPETAPWSAGEVSRVVQAVHARGAKVTAHATRLSGARVGAEAGLDSIEHGFELDGDVARTMAGRGCVLVSTLTVLKSWLTFGATTTIPRFATVGGHAKISRPAGTGEGKHPDRACRGSGDRRWHRFRRRRGACEPAAVGGRVPGGGGPGAVGSAGQRHLARRRAARGAGCRRHLRGRPRRLLARGR